MDIRPQMLEHISDAKREIISDAYVMHDYTSMSEKKRKNLLKIDPYFNYDEFVAIFDLSLTNSAKAGVVFTTSGVYIEGTAFEHYFVNYADIAAVYLAPGSGRHLVIKTTTSGNLECSVGLLEKENGGAALSELLTRLATLALQNNYGRGDRASGKVDKKLKFTQDETIKANLIIHPASAAAAGVGAGLAQIPLSDSFVIIPIQIAMIVSLGATFGISVTEGAAKGIITGAAAGYVGRGVSQVLAGWIPGAGNAVNAATAAAITQAIGWIAARHFKIVQRGGFFEGMKAGNVQAARQFEKKYRKQAEEFIKKQKVFESERDEWIQLIADYIRLIAEYEALLGDKASLSKSAELKAELEKLHSLKVVRN